MVNAGPLSGAIQGASMSLDTWKAKFYPIPADKCKKNDAAAHSILKWSGLKASTLRKHGLWGCRTIGDDSGDLSIDGVSCSLCRWYWKAGHTMTACIKCPGYKANGKRCADAFSVYLGNGNTAPMMRWLKKIPLDKAV